MKKRRELDALIGNRAKKENQEGPFDYDSLNSSLSSPAGDVYMPPNYHTAVKRISRSSPNGCGCTLRKIIRFCLPVCFLSLVVACITACIGIVWLQVQLKTDVDRLKDHVSKLETWQVEQPLSLNDMKKAIVDLTNDVNRIQDGELGIKNLAEKLAILKEKFEEQEKTPLKKLDEVEADSIAVKTRVDRLEAKVGELESESSKSKTSHQMLVASYSKLKDTVDSMQNQVSSDNVKHEKSVQQVKSFIDKQIGMINQTVAHVLKNMEVLDGKIESVKEENANTLNSIQQNIGLLHHRANIPVSTNKPMQSRRPKPAKPSIRVNPTEAVVKNPDHSSSSKNAQTFVPTPFSEIVSDVKAKFQAIDSDSNNALSQEELERHYNERTASVLMRYDSNRDGVLARSEIDNVQLQSSTNANSKAGDHPGR